MFSSRNQQHTGLCGLEYPQDECDAFLLKENFTFRIEDIVV